MKNQVRGKKTIAFYIGSLSRGGAEHVIVNLADHFKKTGYETVIVTKLKDEDEYAVPEGVERILADLTDEELSSSRVKNLLRRILKLRKIWKEIKADCIVSFIKKNNFMAIVSSRFLKIPVIISVRSDPAREYPDFVSRSLVKVLFPMADKIVLQTNQAKKYFSKRIQKKSVILLNSIGEQFEKEVYKGERKKEIVWVGRMDSNKNPKLLLDAFISCAKIYSDWQIKFVGNGPELEELKKIVTEENLEKEVIFTGISLNVAEEIRKSSIFVLTSKKEGMPNALIEAMVLGLAVIATDCPCGGPAELIKNEENGILIPVDDVDALRNQLKELIDCREKRMRLAEEASKIILKVKPDIVNRQWTDCIEELIK